MPDLRVPARCVGAVLLTSLWMVVVAPSGIVHADEVRGSAQVQDGDTLLRARRCGCSTWTRPS